MAIAPQSDPSSRTKVAARTPPAVSAGGAYVVQVSAQKTEAEALSSYQTMQSKYPGVLANRTANIRRADLGDKGVYFRAQIGPFATSEQANTFCTSLKDAGGQCIVQKN
jgi:cell division septation protein DedD